MLELPIVLSTSFCLRKICHSSRVCSVVFLMEENNIFWYSCLYQKWENKKPEKALFPEKWMRASHHSPCICSCPVPVIFWVWDARYRTSCSCSFVCPLRPQPGRTADSHRRAGTPRCRTPGTSQGHSILLFSSPSAATPSLPRIYHSVRFLPRRPALS